MILGIFICDSTKRDEVFTDIDAFTCEWTMRAARNECEWVCASCSVTFPDGMPDKCEWDQQRCTDIITDNKKQAYEEKGLK
jgi:hypothetical protein